MLRTVIHDIIYKKIFNYLVEYKEVEIKYLNFIKEFDLLFNTFVFRSKIVLRNGIINSTYVPKIVVFLGN